MKAVYDLPANQTSQSGPTPLRLGWISRSADPLKEGCVSSYVCSITRFSDFPKAMFS